MGHEIIGARIPAVDLNNPRPTLNNQQKHAANLIIIIIIIIIVKSKPNILIFFFKIMIMIMAVECNLFPQFPNKLNKTTSPQQFTPLYISNTRLFSTRKNPSFFISNTPKLSNNRVVSALNLDEKVGESSFSGTDAFKLTYLEGNSWLWEVGGVKILVDPILVGNLDFGIPFLYDASKKYLKDFKLTDLPEVDCLLITQSLDDHCHLKTLKPLSEKLPNLKVIATPNAKKLLDPLFSNVIYLEPGENTDIQIRNGSQVKVKATPGPILGPPWQRPENGYIVTSPRGELSLYYEPHCVYNKELIGKENADIIVTPVIKQLLPGLTLVSGQEDAVQLAKLLRSKYVVTMRNGDLVGKGLLTTLIKTNGTLESFKELLSRELPDVKTLEPIPGVPLDISSS